MEELRASIQAGKFTAPVQWGGAGPPLLFLHGAAGPMTGAPFLEKLAEDFAVYAPTHPGFGCAEGIEQLDGILDLALYYLDFVDELRIESPHLVGHSLGGMLAAEMAALAPYRFARLVLVGPAGLWLDEAPIPDFFTMSPEEVLHLALHDPEGPVGKAMLAQMSAPEAALDLHNAMAAAAKFLWPIPDKGLKKRLHRVRVPTLLVWGESDRLIPPVYGDAFLKGIAGSRLVVMREAAHMPMLEKDAAFVKLVADFLKG